MWNYGMANVCYCTAMDIADDATLSVYPIPKPQIKKIVPLPPF